MSSSAIPVRPRSVSELVDGAFQLLRRNYAQFVMLMGIAYVPWLVITMLLTRSMFVDAASGVPTTSISRTLVMALGALIWFSVIDGAITIAASQSYLGRRVDVGESLRRAFALVGALVGVAIVRGVVTFLGFLFLIVPGLYFLAKFFAAPAAVVLERAGMGAALARSSALSEGLKGHVLKTLLLVFVIYLVLSIALGAVAGAVIGGVGAGAAASPLVTMLTQIVSAIFTILIYPLISIAQTLLYYDLRIKKEGYDIELMASDLGSAA